MCCFVGKLQKMKTLIRKRRLFGTRRVRVGLELSLGVNLGASKLLIADSRYAIHGNRVPVTGIGYTTQNMDCSMDTNASATIGKNENAEYCCTSIII